MNKFVSLLTHSFLLLSIAPAMAETPLDTSKLPSLANSNTAPDATQQHTQKSPVRGVVRSTNEATLSSGIPAQIQNMPFQEGMSFKKGELLVQFNCDKQQAEYRAAREAIKVKRNTVNTNKELQKFESIGQFELTASIAELNQVTAQAQALASEVSHCSIKAPYAGQVKEQLALRYESVTAGQPVISIIDTQNLEVDMVIPSHWLTWLTVKTNFSFSVDETRQSFTGKIARISPSVNPVSKTVKVIGQLMPPESNQLILPGMSGTAHFE